MGDTDAIQILVNLSKSLLGSSVKLVFILGSLFAVVGAVAYLIKQRQLSSKAPGQTDGPGKAVAMLLLCGGLASIEHLIGAGARQFGWSGASFDAISYVSVGTFGAGADAANALLSLVRMMGVIYSLQGVLLWRRSLKDGHTGLSASSDVSSGTLKFVIGVLCVCIPYLLDAFQKTFIGK